jgi:hypothetical protein
MEEIQLYLDEAKDMMQKQLIILHQNWLKSELAKPCLICWMALW